MAKYKCDSCGKEVEADEVQQCCGMPMKKIEE